MYNTARNNASGCPNDRVLLYQPARLSNKQKCKRANYISGNGRKIIQRERRPYYIQTQAMEQQQQQQQQQQ